MMKQVLQLRVHSSVIFVVIFVVSAAFYAMPATADFLGDMPEIKNKTPIHVMLEAGGSADAIIPYIKEFEERTGVKVTTESQVFAAMYSKVIVEYQAETGAYDLAATESSYSNEFEAYLAPLAELAEKYDPKGVAGLKEATDGFDPGVIRMCSSAEGVLVGLPFYTFTMLCYYREDVFTNPIEQENFKATYGYELAPPTNWDQYADIAEFFRRDKGDTLKGEPLDHDIYGITLIAGRFPHVQDEVGSRLWSKGGRWARTVRDENGKPLGFKITKKDREILEWAFAQYQDMMQYSPPGSKNAMWDKACQDYANGIAMMICPMYGSLWNFASSADEQVPGAKSKAAVVAGGRPYTGVFHFAPSKDSKNQEASYWLARYLCSTEIQRKMANDYWASPNVDAITSLPYQDPNAYRKLGWVEPIIETWSGQRGDINSYLHFNSKAFGKLYSEMTIIGHENAIGKRTPKESVDEWVKKFVEIQNKFGKLKVLEVEE